jgi:hypothetical protein
MQDSSSNRRHFLPSGFSLDAATSSARAGYGCGGDDWGGVMGVADGVVVDEEPELEEEEVGVLMVVFSFTAGVGLTSGPA